jgi:hypothetical protein
MRMYTVLPPPSITGSHTLTFFANTLKHNQLVGKGGKRRIGTTGTLFGEMAIIGLSPGMDSQSLRLHAILASAVGLNFLIHYADGKRLRTVTCSKVCSSYLDES